MTATTPHVDLLALDPTYSARENLRYEIAQRRETGYDTSAVEAALKDLGEDAPEAALWELFEALADAPRDPEWAYREPESLDDVVSSLRPASLGIAPAEEVLADKVLGGWLGRIAGCNLGKPVEWGEHWTRGHLRTYLESVDAYPLLDYVPKQDEVDDQFAFLPNWTETTLGRVHGSARDDDLDYSILGLHLLEKFGRGYTSDDVAGEWLMLLPILQTGSERVNLRNLVAGLRPPTTASHHNPHREWIGAQIRADVHGWTNPGDPRAAALQSYADAVLTHTGNGVYGEMWAAALVAAAFTAPDARAALSISLDHVPPRSRLAEAVRSVLGWYDDGLSWDAAMERIDEAYGHYHWVHSINNAADVAAGLLWAEGDFSAAVGLTVQAGRDTDSAGATAGSVAGVLAGAAALPRHWVDPLENRIATAVFGYDGISISELADRTVAVALDRADPPESGREDYPPLLLLQAQVALTEREKYEVVAVQEASAWPADEPSDLAGIIATLPVDTSSPTSWTEERLTERVLGGWLGRIAGCNLGKPVENGDHWTRGHLRTYLEAVDAYPLLDWIPKIDGDVPGYEFRDSWPETTRGRVHGSARDDDIDYPILGLHVLEKYGRDYTSSDVAAEWLHLLPVLQTYSAEIVTIANLAARVLPPDTASYLNPFREWIGAQIRGDVHGWTNPGDPRAAALQAYADAALSHTGNGIYGEMWSAALVAAAFTAPDARAAVDASLRHVPPQSRLAEAVRSVVASRDEGLSWEQAMDRVDESYGHYHWVHSVNNACHVVAGLLWAEGDFSASIGLTVQAGRDTDSNGATAGSVAGIIAGASGIPPHWVDPLEDSVTTAVFGFTSTRISDLAARTVAFALEH